MAKTRHHVELTAEVIFKAGFKKAFLPKILRAALIVDGRTEFSPSWKDVAGYIGANLTSVLGLGVTTVLVGVCVIPAVLIPAITIPIGLASAAGYVGFVFYRINKKSKEYQQLVKEWHGRDVDKEIDNIADTLTSLYSQQINYLNRNSIILLAEFLSDVILYAMMKKKLDNIDDLTDAAKMQHLLLSLSDHIPKEKVAISLDDGAKRNLRSAINKAGVFCEENASIYVHDKARPEKYGVIRLKTLDDLETFRFFEPEKRYHKLKNEQKQELLKCSIFKEDDAINAYITDSVYRDPFYFSKNK